MLLRQINRDDVCTPFLFYFIMTHVNILGILCVPIFIFIFYDVRTHFRHSLCAYVYFVFDDVCTHFRHSLCAYLFVVCIL